MTGFLIPLPLNPAPRPARASDSRLFLGLTIYVLPCRLADHDDRRSNTAITPNEYSLRAAGSRRAALLLRIGMLR